MRRLLALAATVLSAGSVFAGSALHAAAAAISSPAPVSIPAVRQWVPGTGVFQFGAGSRIVLGPDGAGALGATARVFAADLAALEGRQVAVTSGTVARPGDIELTLAANAGGAAGEGYRIVVGPSIVASAATEDGVFDATRTILQWLHQGYTVAAGTALDWPSYPERGLMVDVGRKYFSISWLQQEIREMSYLKLNLLHLHLSDANGFRLQSDTHPEIVAAQHYTKQQIRDLVAYAASYHVQIVPEIDMPAHLDPVLAAHPNLRLVSSTGAVAPGLIDLSNPAAYALMRDLITEFLPLFPGNYWHIGADEYVSNYADYPQLTTYAKAHYGQNATGLDTFYGFVNWADGLVRAAGKTTRMWNDGLRDSGSTITVNADIVVEHWSASGPGGLPWIGPAETPTSLVRAGHRVFNDAFTPTYYTTGLSGQLLTAPASVMYDLWNPNVFVDGSQLSTTDRSANLGASLDVWCDDPTAQTEDQIAAGIYNRLRIMAQQTWGSPKPAPLYALFLPLINAVGHAPA